VSDKADRFLALIDALRAMSPAERQRTIDQGKRDRAPKVRLFFECLERELAAWCPTCGLDRARRRRGFRVCRCSKKGPPPGAA